MTIGSGYWRLAFAPHRRRTRSLMNTMGCRSVKETIAKIPTALMPIRAQGSKSPYSSFVNSFRGGMA